MTATVADAGTPRSAPSSDRRAVQVARRIEDEILARGWPVGEVLGSEAELRERFGVSRSVLREAVRLLEHHQVARMRRGPNGGLFVAAPDIGPVTRALVVYLEFVGTSVDDLMRARLLLEPLSVRLAAGAVTEELRSRLREVLAIERERWDEWDLRTDDDLHVILSRSSGNAALRLLIEVLVRLTARYARASQSIPGEDPDAEKAGAHQRNIRIVEAVSAGDAKAAEAVMAEQLEWSAQWMKDHQARRPAGQLLLGPSDARRSNGRKLAELVADRIHDDIAADGWRVGSVFGSEADLLGCYGVSRSVLREAVRLLEHHSVARMRRGAGGGLVVQAPDPTASIHTTALYLDREGIGPADLCEVREAIELACVQALAGGAVPPGAADRLRAAVGHGDAFHRELASAAGNPVLAVFLRIVTELWTRQGAGDPPSACLGDEEDRQAHGSILEAVGAGDCGLAQQLMRRHLQALADEAGRAPARPAVDQPCSARSSAAM
ncbi:FCD domain-containing protein [Streptacidiphilus sp. N1-10]|uniref:FCD domain-containing protein n=1 Tax=Streptacidiphilus jeojiensis TaxID=3229225 RepID=A0ABV6XG70_9ACTN